MDFPSSQCFFFKASLSARYLTNSTQSDCVNIRGAMENRTPIYDLQNHCNSRYTIAPNATCLLASQANPLMADFVTHMGFEPMPYHRK